ncbi:pyridoxal-phosphate dependent enzyme [Chitinophagaceae bacterium LB-8]|uniref:Pyridoxal-phosphate dependent enzyme n=1 Tax=Paraflavisolibacter caeni TaxID=2982496 RepID=A0A9X3BHK4_9BACT|nr:pyridoxal-phosphate dependent enzyme [Paraflavisolibacter caeni]MCU7552474.1 pyridoxal-phosphate dependent enzyme [Paraflavisolibacter caeni]
MQFPGKVQPEIHIINLPGSLKASVLRLDMVHPVVSGNKWYKLKEYLKEAKEQRKSTIVTFGGAFSNHIVATAAACKSFGIESIGIIRGERPKNLSNTLQDALAFGMHLIFLSREEYKKKSIPQELYTKHEYEKLYFVNEGGYGYLGMLGAASIIEDADIKSYTHLLTAVGTGTTLAGLLKASQPYQELIGISVMKNNFSLNNSVEQLIPDKSNFKILHDFHFGGYAKSPSELLNFMNQWYLQTGIPSDFVYTGKLFYAFEQLVARNFFPSNSNILLIHSGGLQGNRSLPEGSLLF